MTFQSFNLAEILENNPSFFANNLHFYQNDAIKNLNIFFDFKDNSFKSGMLVLPTGTGKTLTVVRWILEKIITNSYKVLWLAQASHLLDQAFETFENNILVVSSHKRQNVNIRVVSSNTNHCSVNDIQVTDDIVITTTHTAINAIHHSGLDISAQSHISKLEKFIKNAEKSRLIVIIDEAHHTPAYGCRNLLIGGNENRKSIIDLIPNAYFLGLTATPTHSDKNIRDWLTKIFNAKQPKQNVGILYEADKVKLTSEGYLAKPIFIPQPTGLQFEIEDRLYDKIMRENTDLPKEIVDRIAQDTPRNEFIAKHYIEHKKEYGKTLIFVDRKVQCICMNEIFKKFGIKSDYVISHIDPTPNSVEERNKRGKNENDIILEKFRKNELDVLINVKMLTEGTDVPDIQTVFITRQTRSSILLTQMIGRALRADKTGAPGKTTANIVMFNDTWKNVINWASAEIDGDALDKKPITKYRPLEYIAISLIENLAKIIESGIVFNDVPYLTFIPVGWYRFELSIFSKDDDGNESTGTYMEFVMVFEHNKNKFEKFISEIKNQLSNDWENDDLSDEWMKPQVLKWIEKYFDKDDDIGQTLYFDLIKLARNIAQNKTRIFHSFKERKLHDLDKIAEELLEFNEFVVRERLNVEYNDTTKYWKAFYSEENKFKTAFDAARNFAWHIKQFGSIPKLEIEKSTYQRPDRELTEIEKEQIKRRDNYTCQCCGKQQTTGVILEIDHIITDAHGGKTEENNSQTLCSVCNADKGINDINFRVHKNSQILSPKNIEFYSSKEDYPEFALKRTINFFYHCSAVSNLKTHKRSSGQNYNVWEIELYSGNKAEWLIQHKTNLIQYIQNELKCPQVTDLKIISPE